jgi:hypothetical protein
MTSFALKVESALLLVAALIGDCFLYSLRCSLSPDIDWSRLCFALVLQVVAIAMPLAVTDHAFGENEKIRPWVASLAVFLLVVATVPMARDSLLLADKILEKGYNSVGLQCPGVWR